MPILVDKKTKALVQGITGRQGSLHTRLMLEYGTNIVAGVTPGKGGESVEGVPVYDTVREAAKHRSPTSHIIFVPAPHAYDAVMEGLDANLSPIVLITEGVPIHDAVKFIGEAKNQKATIIGPNTPGIITPGECKLGIMPGHIFKEGSVGVVSRSGTLTYEISWTLTRAGYGQSTCLGLGGDPVTGLDFVDVLQLFKKDRKTKAVVMIGEIGGDAEEKAAAYVEKDFDKPVVAYIAGKSAPPGKRMGHAGAIIDGSSGTAESKIDALRKAGVLVAETPSQVVKLLGGLAPPP